jgi:2-hydroxychromene-2-carboxylate isomerase
MHGLFEPVHRLLRTTSEWQRTGDFEPLLHNMTGFDISDWNMCRGRADVAEQLQRDSILARNLSVAGTPTFVSRRGIHVGVPTVRKLLDLAR